MSVLGLDIGGANLKASDGRAWHRARSFALWRAPDRLPDELALLLRDAPAATALAVTMTGELADCYSTKAEGVDRILRAVEAVAAGRRVIAYLVGGQWASPDEARARPWAAAASNWHALAAYAGAWLGREWPVGLYLDVGSTTTDIVPLVEGRVATQGQTDPERLASGELVYTGVVRSPVCGVVRRLPWRGQSCGVAQELFATTLDAWLWLDELAEDRRECGTADGRPATRAAARDRLARQLGADRTVFSDDDARAVATVVAHAQVAQVAAAWRQVVERLPARPAGVIVSGQGEFLARRTLAAVGWQGSVVSLAAECGDAASVVAPAWAVARLAADGRDESTHVRRAADGGPVPVSAASRVPRRVVKLGGSLLDLPDLVARLRGWLAGQPPAENVLLVGGGRLADALRDADRTLALGDTAAHGLCLRVLGIHAEMLRGLMPEMNWVGSLAPLRDLAPRPRGVLFDLGQFVAVDDAAAADALPARWDVTTDSIAARVADFVRADELVLLKSTLPTAGTSVSEAAERGLVDAYFPWAAAAWKRVRVVDLRAEPCREAWLDRDAVGAVAKR